MKRKRIRKINTRISQRLCYHYRQLYQQLKNIDEPKDAAAMRKSKPNTAPVTLLPMIF